MSGGCGCRRPACGNVGCDVGRRRLCGLRTFGPVLDIHLHGCRPDVDGSLGGDECRHSGNRRRRRWRTIGSSNAGWRRRICNGPNERHGGPAIHRDRRWWWTSSLFDRRSVALRHDGSTQLLLRRWSRRKRNRRIRLLLRIGWWSLCGARSRCDGRPDHGRWWRRWRLQHCGRSRRRDVGFARCRCAGRRWRYAIRRRCLAHARGWCRRHQVRGRMGRVQRDRSQCPVGRWRWWRWLLRRRRRW